MAKNILNDNLEKIQTWANQWLVTFSAAKTKSMTMSFKKTKSEPLKFNDTELNEVDEHKHLGLTLSNNLTWSSHIDNIISDTGCMSDVLKRLKYDLDKRTLEKVYFSFIRPKLEYASHIWDNCSKRDSDKLEQFQMEVARTVTGARRGTSHDLINSELRWETLSTRRKNVKLLNMYKMVHNKSPAYLCNLLPNNRAEPCYNLRNKENLPIPKTRTELFRKSFVPSSINLWNSLSCEKKYIDIEQFKRNLKDHDSVKELYYLGSRANNIKHAQLRMQCSKLNSHLFSLHVLDNPSCPCGAPDEDSFHFFYNCPLYIPQRQILMNEIANFHITDWNMLLFGNENLNFEDNTRLFQAVHKYIENTNRL